MLFAVKDRSPKITNHERLDGCLYLRSEAGLHRLMPMNDSTIRISFAPKDEFKEKINNKPKKLYKYKCLNSNTIDSIRNDYLWLSKPSVLNDPFESFVNADFNPNKLINFAEDYQFFSDEGLTKLWHERVEKSENIIEVLKQMTDEIENEDDRTLAKDKLYYCYKNMCEFYMQSSLDFTKLIDNSFLIGSLTTNPLSITMWSHYADSHNGVCIEYDLSENP